MFSRSSERVRGAEVALEASKVRHEQETRIHDELCRRKAEEESEFRGLRRRNSEDRRNYLSAVEDFFLSITTDISSILTPTKVEKEFKSLFNEFKVLKEQINGVELQIQLLNNDENTEIDGNNNENDDDDEERNEIERKLEEKDHLMRATKKFSFINILLP
jgi:hypothetical protein